MDPFHFVLLDTDYGSGKQIISHKLLIIIVQVFDFFYFNALHQQPCINSLFQIFVGICLVFGLFLCYLFHEANPDPEVKNEMDSKGSESKILVKLIIFNLQQC